MTSSAPPVPSPDLVRLAETLADTAGPILRRYFRTNIVIDDKSDDTPVTIADRDAEAAMRAVITQACPDHGILGEEYGPERVDADYVWVLDPVDGTRAFITGKPSFGTLIALLYQGRPVLGIIDQPITRERWLGVLGQPTTLNGAPVQVRACAQLDQAALYATGPEMFKGDDWADFSRLRAQVKLPRYGADCYAYALLATGFVDLVVEADLKPYDYCAMVPVIEGAGGIITDWHGSPLSMASDGRVCASGDLRLHARAVAVLADKGA